MTHGPQRKIVALSGGVGGARFADGLAAALPAGSLTVIVNTGDDFEHWGLSVSPDLDTVMYTLSGLADEARGWGLCGETFRALDMVKRYGGEDWFALGDDERVLATTCGVDTGEPATVELRHDLDLPGETRKLRPTTTAPTT